MGVDKVLPVVRKRPKIQPHDSYKYGGKKINKFAIWKQTKERENNKYENERGQILRGSAMCLRPRAFKLAKASILTNQTNSPKSYKGEFFKKKTPSKASQNPKHKFSPYPNWSHTKNPQSDFAKSDFAYTQSFIGMATTHKDYKNPTPQSWKPNPYRDAYDRCNQNSKSTLSDGKQIHIRSYRWVVFVSYFWMLLHNKSNEWSEELQWRIFRKTLIKPKIQILSKP